MAQKKPKKRVYLTPELESEIVECVIETYQREMEHQRKISLDKRLRNTKLLLEHYRDFAAFSDDAIYEASQCDEDVYDVLSLMSYGRSKRELFVESIKTSAIRTKLIIEHIDKALKDYGIYCERSKKDEEKRRYRAIRRLYIEDEAWDVQKIAEVENVDVSTVYKDVKEAVKRLTPRIFGIDGIR